MSVPFLWGSSVKAFLLGDGAGEGNRTPVATLGRSSSAIEPHLHYLYLNMFFLKLSQSLSQGRILLYTCQSELVGIFQDLGK